MIDFFEVHVKIEPCNNKLERLLLEFEIKLKESLNTDHQGIKESIKKMSDKEYNRSGIATLYILHHRSCEFENAIPSKHKFFRK